MHIFFFFKVIIIYLSINLSVESLPVQQEQTNPVLENNTDIEFESGMYIVPVTSLLCID